MYANKKSQREVQQYHSQLQNMAPGSMSNPMAYTHQPQTIPFETWYQMQSIFPCNPAGSIVQPGYSITKHDLQSLRSKILAMKDKKAEKLEAEVPDRIDPIVAYRAWYVAGSGIGGIGHFKSWEPGKVNEAQCSASCGRPCPEMGCGCGFWGFKTLEFLLGELEAYDGKALCVGMVYLWGRYIECEKGWRSQYAYPKELWLTEPWMERAARAFNVPVRKL